MTEPIEITATPERSDRMPLSEVVEAWIMFLDYSALRQSLIDVEFVTIEEE